MENTGWGSVLHIAMLLGKDWGQIWKGGIYKEVRELRGTWSSAQRTKGRACVYCPEAQRGTCT